MKREKRKPVAIQEARFGIEWVIDGKEVEKIYHYSAAASDLTYQQFINKCVNEGKAQDWEMLRCFVA